MSKSILYTIAGTVILIAVWWGLAEFLAQKRPDVTISANIEDLPAATRDSILRVEESKLSAATTFKKVYPILPTPLQVVEAFPKLVQSPYNLWQNLARSLWLNLRGYFWAILISVPLGFLLGLIPAVKSLFSKHVDALRYLPLTALTGLFITWFGLDDSMKIAFLSFGILVYMLPVVVSRIADVEDVYLKTVYTLGATKWQTIKSVYLPAVLSKFMDDIRVLTAISWTYIIIAEMQNNVGGIGALAYTSGKRGRIDQVFAILLLVIVIGILQDRIFVWLDKRLFPHKYYKTSAANVPEVRWGIFSLLGVLAFLVLLPALIPSFAGALTTIGGLVAVASVALILLGEFKMLSKKPA
jgi:NitT/TauT family transport system permease protein